MVVFVACWISLGFRLNGMLTFMCGRGGREKVFSPWLFIILLSFIFHFSLVDLTPVCVCVKKAFKESLFL